MQISDDVQQVKSVVKHTLPGSILSTVSAWGILLHGHLAMEKLRVWDGVSVRRIKQLQFSYSWH
jgi:hypothetical protein